MDLLKLCSISDNGTEESSEPAGNEETGGASGEESAAGTEAGGESGSSGEPEKEPGTDKGKEEPEPEQQQPVTYISPPLVNTTVSVPDDLTSRIDSLLAALNEASSTPESTWVEGAYQWNITFLGKTFTVYSEINPEHLPEFYIQASDGNYVTGHENLQLYEEYLYYMTGTVIGCGVRAFDSDGGYDIFVQCSDGMYVLDDDQAVYEEWILTREQEEQKAAEEQDFEDALLENLIQFRNDVSGNMIAMQEQNSSMVDYGMQIDSSIKKLLGVELAIAGIIGFIAGISLAKALWDRMKG